MKLSLVVRTPGKTQGKTVPVCQLPFVIGRGPGCQLRPASRLVSGKHCALVARGGRLFVQDFNSRNGTYLNGRYVRGEVMLCDDDCLRVGPWEFVVRITGEARAVQPTRPAEETVEETAAEALLMDNEAPPRGKTQLQLPSPAARPADQAPDTAAAARALLDRYLRRPRPLTACR